MSIIKHKKPKSTILDKSELTEEAENDYIEAIYGETN